jgi:hypothetical protein
MTWFWQFQIFAVDAPHASFHKLESSKSAGRFISRC